MAEGTEQDEMTAAEKKFLMVALWDALISRKWTKDDLIDFGKAIFAKKPLKTMEEGTFKKIFPYLSEVVVDLGSRIAAEADRQAASLTRKIVEEEFGKGTEAAEPRKPPLGASEPRKPNPGTSEPKTPNPEASEPSEAPTR